LDNLPEYLASRKLQPTYLQKCKYIEGHELQCGDDDDDAVAVGPATMWEFLNSLQDNEAFLEKTVKKKQTAVCFFSIIDFPRLNDLREGSQADDFMNALSQITDPEKENEIFKIDSI
jgi:hypothetical protein